MPGGPSLFFGTWIIGGLAVVVLWRWAHERFELYRRYQRLRHVPESYPTHTDTVAPERGTVHSNPTEA